MIILHSYKRWYEPSTDAYLEPTQKSKMEFFPKRVNGLFSQKKPSILDVWLGSEYVFDQRSHDHNR